MDDTPNSSHGEMPLPIGFKSIEEIRNIPNHLLKSKPPVNVIGFVKDFQPPMKTRGTDLKCTIEIMDHTNQGMKVEIFEKTEEEMPPRPGRADVVLIRNIKAQWFNSAVSLLKHRSSEFHFLASSKIPKKTISGGPNAPWRSYPLGKGRYPTSAEMDYVIWANNRVEEMDLPSEHEYTERTIQAERLNKDKFSLLKDVKPDRFYNILGEVVKLYDASGSLTVHLSDYTANKNFYNHIGEDGLDDRRGQEGDEYGYIRPKPKAGKDWPGPLGKMSIQLTLFDEHAQFMRENVTEKTWVLLKNVQIKYGRMGGVLEGYMRGDENKMNVNIIKFPEGTDEDRTGKEEDPRCRETEDPNFKPALQRKLKWTFEKKSQNKLLEGVPENKRKHGGEGPSKSNSKKRREEKRAAGLKKVAAEQAKIMQRLNLNDNIRCNHPDQPIVSLSEIVKPQTLIKNEEGQQIPSSFTCARYRSNVKVVDFFPHKIEDFAVGRRASQFDVLSDYSGGEDTDREEEMRVFKSGKGFAKNIWKWRFALQVEDADPKGSKERLWLIVKNDTAQGLLGLKDDATNLRANSKLLSQVKEQLFKLWGDLEERKSEMLRQQSKGKEDIPLSSLESEFQVSARKSGDMPDADSDVENESSATSSKKKSSSSVLTERDPNISISGIVAGKDEKSEANLAAKNKAFTCCIQQYGVKVDEDDPAKANAGDGKRWQRVFGLFDTFIA